MTLAAHFQRAADRLGVEPDVDPKTLRRAYRRAVREAPPDTHPEAFREVRDAYELLLEPLRALEVLMVQERPFVEPPPLPLPPRGYTARLVLREVLRSIDVDQLLEGHDHER
ncbi:MAG: DnaJ domain-containing protein [Myxococcota bacterium]